MSASGTSSSAEPRLVNAGKDPTLWVNDGQWFTAVAAATKVSARSAAAPPRACSLALGGRGIVKCCQSPEPDRDQTMDHQHTYRATGSPIEMTSKRRGSAAQGRCPRHRPCEAEDAAGGARASIVMTPTATATAAGEALRRPLRRPDERNLCHVCSRTSQLPWNHWVTTGLWPQRLGGDRPARSWYPPTSGKG